MLPLIPVVAALTTGGQLVAHSAGGLIVLSSTGSYVAGTYIATAALGSFLTGTAFASAASGLALAGGAIVWGYGTVAGATMTLIGGAGFFGTTIGATGLTGLLMSWGIIPAVPIIFPITVVIFSFFLAIAVGAGFARRVRNLRRKTAETPDGEEATFTSREAKLTEKLILSASRPHSWLWRALMKFLGRKSPRPQN